MLCFSPMPLFSIAFSDSEEKQEIYLYLLTIPEWFWIRLIEKLKLKYGLYLSYFHAFMSNFAAFRYLVNL